MLISLQTQGLPFVGLAHPKPDMHHCPKTRLCCDVWLVKLINRLRYMQCSHLLIQCSVESKGRNELHHIYPGVVILVVVLHQQIVQQAGSKHPQERNHIGGLGVCEEDAGQEGEGYETVSPDKEENDLETIVCETKELEVDC